MLESGRGEKYAAHHLSAHLLEILNHGAEALALGNHIVEDNHLASVEETAVELQDLHLRTWEPTSQGQGVSARGVASSKMQVRSTTTLTVAR